MKIGILDMYMYLPIIALIVGMGFVFFSDDVFRYECQDPVNWGTPDCEPPFCKAAGVCTEDLIKFENVTIEENINENAISDSQNEITNYFDTLECSCKEEEVNGE